MVNKQYNLGLCLIRMLMCYVVILCHFGNSKDAHGIASIFFLLKSEAVPVFMLLSFSLTKKIYTNKDKYQFIYRMKRLVYPQIGWTVIYFVFYVLADLILKMDKSISITQFFWQLTTGHCPQLNPTMWYQVVMIILTIGFWCIFYFCTMKQAIVSIIVLAGVSLILQYSSINYLLFGDLRYELTPLGRIAEMIPYATLGFILGHCEIKKNWKKILCFAIGLIVLSLFIPDIQGFGYSGILRLGVALMLIMVFYLLPLDRMVVTHKKIILLLSKYTLGIYCMHKLVGIILDNIMNRYNIEINSCILCLIIYIICYCIAIVMAKIPIKICRDIVE